MALRLVHRLLIGGQFNLVQWRGNLASAYSPRSIFWSTKRNMLSINGRCTSHHIALNGVLLPLGMWRIRVNIEPTMFSLTGVIRHSSKPSRIDFAGRLLQRDGNISGSVGDQGIRDRERANRPTRDVDIVRQSRCTRVWRHRRPRHWRRFPIAAAHTSQHRVLYSCMEVSAISVLIASAKD